MDLTVLFETPGGGGLVALTAITSLVIAYYLTLKWVARGQEQSSDDT